MNGVMVVLAEKPSAARDFARHLGARTERGGYFEGPGVRVSWALGHLLQICEPGDQRPEWGGRRRRSMLPMVPEHWLREPRKGVEDQLETVLGLLRGGDVTKIVAATDPGREGELIFRWILDASGVGGKVDMYRLWVSSMTAAAIAKGFAKLEPLAKYDGLAAAARGRARADWLIGMSGSTAMRLSSHRSSVPIGRVMTPTLSMIVARDAQIEDFQPETFFEVDAEIRCTQGVFKARRRAKEGEPRLSEEGRAAAIAERIARGTARITSNKCKPKRSGAPKLFDLTALQIEANKLFGFTAELTSEIAQKLYAERKCLSYPRTDSAYLSAAVAADLREVVLGLIDRYAVDFPDDVGDVRALGKAHVDDARVTDHHALAPVSVPDWDALSENEAKIFDLVCRRILMMWLGDAVELETRIEILVDSGSEGEMPTAEDLLVASGKAVSEEGWRVLDLRERRGGAELPAGVAVGAAEVVDARAIAKKTSPPKRFTEASLLSAMENAGRRLEDEELAAAMKGGGLGTPATRAATIGKIIARGLVAREGRSLVSTELGREAIDASPEALRSPIMTGEWERDLSLVESGELTLQDFMAASIRRTGEICEELLGPAIEIDEVRLYGAVHGAVCDSVRGERSSGQLFKEVGDSIGRPPRGEFEDALDALAAAGKVLVEKRSFKQGEDAVEFRAVRVPEARIFDGVDRDLLDELILDRVSAKGSSSKKLHVSVLGGLRALQREEIGRYVFERALDELAEKERIRSTMETFEKGGETIKYRKITKA